MAVATKSKKTKPATTNAEMKPREEAPLVLGVIPKGQLQEIEVAAIEDPPGAPDRMPRPEDEARIQDTARSMREVGQLQPIMVEKTPGGYVRVFGRRRLAAARLNKAERILAIVVPPLVPEVRRTIVAVENIQRQDLTPAEEHLAVGELLRLQALEAMKQLKVWAPFLQGSPLTDEMIAEARSKPDVFAAWSNDALTVPQIRNRACELVAAMLAKPASWVRDRMYIGRFGEKAQTLILSGKLPLMHAREIAKVADPEIREDLAVSYAAGGDDSVSDHEPGHFADLEREVSTRLFSLKVVPWRLDTPVNTFRACEGCEHNSATNPGLFEHGGSASTQMVGGIGRWSEDADPNAVCTYHGCFAAKLRITKAAIATAAKKIVDGGAKRGSDPNLVKPFVADKALEEKVKSRRLLKSPTGTGRTAAQLAADEKEAERYKAQQARWEAENKHREAMRSRAEKFKKAFLAELNKTPGALALWLLIRETSFYNQTRNSGKKGEAARQSAGFLNLLKKAQKPSVDVLLEIEKKIQPQQVSILEAWSEPELVDVLAKAFSIEVSPPPKLSDFLPKAKAEEKKAAPAKGGRGK